MKRLPRSNTRPLIEVLLDLGGAALDLDRGLHALVEDPGVKPAGRLAGDALAERDRDPIGPAECQLGCQGALKPRPTSRWTIESG